MVFKRRTPLSMLARARAFMWPERGFARAWTYIAKRVQRLNDTPERIALGFACGAFISFSPLFGLHFIVAGLLAYACRANVMAGLLGTVVGNPVTFPLIATLSMSTGQAVLSATPHAHDGAGVIARFVAIGEALLEGMKHAVGIADAGTTTWGEATAMLGGFVESFALPYTIGGLIWGIPVAIASYFIMRPVIGAYQRRRRDKIAQLRDAKPAPKGGAAAIGG